MTSNYADIAREANGFRGLFECSACGSNNMHLDRVAHFDREREDGPTTATVSHANIDGDPGDWSPGRARVTVIRAVDANPSERRNAVLVVLRCESSECGEEAFVTITQHKGCMHLRLDGLDLFGPDGEAIWEGG